MINWSNLSLSAAARMVLKLAYKLGWDRALEIAQKELGEDTEEVVRLAMKYDSGRRW